MQTIEFDRRMLLGVSLLFASSFSNVNAETERSGARFPFAHTQRSSCSVSRAVAELAEENPDFRGFLRAALRESDDAYNDLNAMADDAKLLNTQLEGELRYISGIGDLLDREINIKSLRDYYRVYRDLLESVRSDLTVIVEGPDEVTDAMVVRLFKSLTAINLLNASIVGFPYA